MRSTNITPIQWHHSHGAQLRKSAAPGPKGRRTVHVMDATGKTYCHDMPYIPQKLFEHGFVKGKRREDAIFCQSDHWLETSTGRTLLRH
eukprot:7944098-Pyramimonas_sp.AAC.1